MQKILATKKLTKSFSGVHAVDHIDLAIQERQITGLVGPNGSGKTTLINILSGFSPHDEGKIFFSDTERKKIYPWENQIYGITRTFQQIRLFEQLSVLDNILITLTERGPFRSLFERHSDFHANQATDILKRVGLYEKRSALAAELSYGQRKLLEIARVLSMDCRIILLDEPFAGLFPEVVKLIEKIIQELKNTGKSIILVEHNMDIIRRLSDHLIVMDAGKILAEGNPAEVLNKREVMEAYLGE